MGPHPRLFGHCLNQVLDLFKRFILDMANSGQVVFLRQGDEGSHLVEPYLAMPVAYTDPEEIAVDYYDAWLRFPDDLRRPPHVRRNPYNFNVRVKLKQRSHPLREKTRP